MKKSRRHTALLVLAQALLLLQATSLWAQDVVPDSVVQDSLTISSDDSPRPTKYVKAEFQDEHLVFFQGFTLSADVFNALLYATTDYGTLEAALRLNLKNTYFPIVEAGYGRCTKEDYNTKIRYHTAAPFIRIGADINLLKNKFQDNRLYLGLRYGFSRFNYDISGPEMTDPIWGGSEPFSIKGNSCAGHWFELVFGTQVKVFRNFHMGWYVRYKRTLGYSEDKYAKPDCIPGYGYTTKTTNWGGTYSLIFDLNWGKKKNHKRGVNIEVINVSEENSQQDRTNDETDGNSQ